MKTGIALGLSYVSLEMITASGEVEIEVMVELLHRLRQTGNAC